MPRKLITAGDLLVIAIALLLAIIAYFVITYSSYEPVYAVVSVRNYPDVLLNLSEDREFVLPQNPSVRIIVQNGAAAFAASDCPDQLCVNMGNLRRPGQSAACLPNLVSLAIVGPAEEVDIILVN